MASSSSTSFSKFALVGLYFSLFVLLSSLITTTSAAPLRERRNRFANAERDVASIPPSERTVITPPAERDVAPPTERSATPPTERSAIPPSTNGTGNAGPEYNPLTNLSPEQPSLNFDLTTSLFIPNSTVTPLSTLPGNCALYNTAGGECSTTMSAVNITYDDCSDAFTVCMCDNAQMTIPAITDRLGRVPVGLRRYVGTVVVSAGDTPSAYTLTTGDIHMFGDTQMDTWIHESTHAYDFATGTPISGSQGWLNAIAADTCAADTYGTSNAVEEFAQMAVLTLYYLTHSYTFPAGFQPSCLANQLNFMTALPVFTAFTLFSNTCAAGSMTDGARHVNGPQWNQGAPLRFNKDVPEVFVTTTSAAQPTATAPVQNVNNGPVVTSTSTTTSSTWSATSKPKASSAADSNGAAQRWTVFMAIVGLGMGMGGSMVL